MSEDKEVKIRLSNEVYEKLSKFANDKNLSLRSAVETIINEYFSGSIKEAEFGKPVLIVTKFKSKCVKCGREIEKGENALWVKGLGVICLECSIPHDRSLLSKYIKVKELERVKKMLSEECDKLYKRYSELQVTIQFYELIRDFEEKLKNYLNYELGDSEKLMKVLEELADIREKLSKLSLVIKTIRVKPKKKKPVEVEAYEQQ